MQDQKVRYHSPTAHHIHATEMDLLIAEASACRRARVVSELFEEGQHGFHFASQKDSERHVCLDYSACG